VAQAYSPVLGRCTGENACATEKSHTHLLPTHYSYAIFDKNRQHHRKEVADLIKDDVITMNMQSEVGSLAFCLIHPVSLL